MGQAIDLVVAVCFAAGVNLYLTLLTVGLLGRFTQLPIPASLHFTERPAILIAAGSLFVLSFFADKIPVFDVVWNALHTFIRIPAAALIAYQASAHLSPEARLLISCLGAAIAAGAHGTKLLSRVMVTPSPEPVSNIALSGVEDVGVAGLSWLAVTHPALGALAVAVLAIAAAVVLRWLWQRIVLGLRNLRARGAKLSWPERA